MDATPEFRTPGQLIDHLLAQRGWSHRILAVVLGVEESQITKLISGAKAMSAELALTLGDVFGIEPERLLDLQKSYELARARIEARPNPKLALRAHLFGGLPVAAMIKRGWIRAKDVRDIATVESELTRFFGVSSVEEIETIPHAAKKTVVASPATPAQLAWLYRVKELASDLMVPPYSQAGGESLVADLKGLLSAPELSRHVPRLLMERGIRFVIVETLPGAKIDGVCFWLDHRSPVIALSLRYDRIDNLWFVLRHELEHLLKRHGQGAVMLDAELEGERAGIGPTVLEEERAANEAAADFCVPQQRMAGFVARKAPLFSERDLLGFASTLGIHPGLVAGQIQHITGRHELFRKHLVKIRSSIAPAAVTDGWGDVAHASA